MTAATRLTTWWSERRAWRSAHTLQDLCHLTNQWLTGQIRTQPGYYGPVDIDTAPRLLDALTALNHAGMLTRSSQAGWATTTTHGCAAVEGFAHPDTVSHLTAALNDTPYSVETHPRPRGWRADRRQVPVAWVGADVATEFGGFGPARDIRRQLDGAGHYAVEEAVAALQVVIWDGLPGRNTIWADLAEALDPAPRTADTAQETR